MRADAHSGGLEDRPSGRSRADRHSRQDRLESSAHHLRPEQQEAPDNTSARHEAEQECQEDDQPRHARRVQRGGVPADARTIRARPSSTAAASIPRPMASLMDRIRTRLLPAALTAAGISLVAAGLLGYSDPTAARAPSLDPLFSPSPGASSSLLQV